MQLNGYIDHTLLKPEATSADIKKLCQEAAKYSFSSVCVASHFAKLATKLLRGTGVETCCVVGFPLGSQASEAKAYEARCAVAAHAAEIDMVMNIGLAKEGKWSLVEEDIRRVVEAARPAAVKVILECCLLTDKEKVRASVAAKSAGAAFVKTSTGFSKSGATVEDVRLMREAVGSNMGVKAAGGIRTREDAVRMIEAGASRIGTSAGVAIVTEEEAQA